MSSTEFNKRSRVKVYLFVGAILLVALVAAIVQFVDVSPWGFVSADSPAGEISGQEARPDDEKAEKDATPVELAAVQRGDISHFLAATANLRALREVDIIGQSEGVVMELSTEEGEFVRCQQVLARLDDQEFQIRLQSARKRPAQAGLQLEKAVIGREKAETQIRNNREDLARYQRLYEEKLVSEREVAQLRYKLDELLHDERVSSHEARELAHKVKELEAEIAGAELEIERTRIKAPFDGRITAREVDLGQTVRLGDRLFRLGDFSALFADVFISEVDARQVRAGQPVRISLGQGGDRIVAAQVDRISPVVDQATGTVKVTVRLTQSSEDFKPGSFVRVQVKTDAHLETLLIPKRALLEEDGRFYAFVAHEDTARKVELQLGYVNEGFTEVLSGLDLGQKVVVAGQGSLKEGARIRAVNT